MKTRAARIIGLLLTAAAFFTIGFFLARAIPKSSTPYSLLPTPSPSPTPITIDPGGRAELTAIPDLRPTVENPTIHLIITVADEDTRQPVAAIITIDNQSTRSTSAEVIVAANVPHTITVTAAGYLPWETRLETNLQHHKTMNLPILLRPAPDTG